LTSEQSDRYFLMRHQGESHNMALMLATNSFPGVRGTDSVFMAGSHCQDSPLDRMREEAAKAQGVDTNGKRYISGLARFSNDPEAWVSGLGDVKRICEERGWNCHGAIDVEAPEATGDPWDGEYQAAPDLIEDHVERRLGRYDERQLNDSLIGDIRHDVVQELSGHVNLSPGERVSDYEDPFTLPGMEE
jgi:hypothetical protein